MLLLLKVVCNSAFRSLVWIIERSSLKVEPQILFQLISNFCAARFTSLIAVCNGVGLRDGTATHPILFGFGKIESQ
jgi:hypothetical protein